MKMQTAKSRTWFFPTSPRSPYKLQGELGLLKKLEGKCWDQDTQEKYAKLLAKYKGFEGETSVKYSAFTARDRVNRAPRLLGFVYLPQGGKAPFEFTRAGKEFLDSENPMFIFQRQLAKVQFPSPLHNSKGFENMNVRPLIVVLSMLQKLGRLTKEEVALFCVTATDENKIDRSIREVIRFREGLLRLKGKARRLAYRRHVLNRKIKSVFAKDISSGSVHSRQGGEDITTFYKKKRGMLKDYADAAIRYFQATGLFTTDSSSLKMSIENRNSIDYLMKYTSKRPLKFKAGSENIRSYVMDYLGNPDVPELYADKPEVQEAIVQNAMVKVASAGEKKMLSKRLYEAKTKKQKLEIVSKAIETSAKCLRRLKQQELETTPAQHLPNIIDIFKRIGERDDEIIDRPLAYEWNIWRSFVVLDHAVAIEPFFKLDADGNPSSTAAGNGPDLIIEYQDYWLVVEVTLQAGMRQYETEGEPVTRHVGQFQKSRIEQGDTRPVYGLFIADQLQGETVNHFYTLANVKGSKVYLKPVRIVPMPREVLQTLLLKYSCFDKAKLKVLLEVAIDSAHNADNEEVWLDSVIKHVACM